MKTLNYFHVPVSSVDTQSSRLLPLAGKVQTDAEPQQIHLKTALVLYMYTSNTTQLNILAVSGNYIPCTWSSWCSGTSWCSWTSWPRSLWTTSTVTRSFTCSTENVCNAYQFTKRAIFLSLHEACSRHACSLKYVPELVSEVREVCVTFFGVYCSNGTTVRMFSNFNLLRGRCILLPFPSALTSCAAHEYQYKRA